MNYEEFINSLEADSCPDHLHPCLQALWFDAKGDWDKAHSIVQNNHDTTSARVHAYLHRQEGDEWNSKYWHRQAGTVFPDELTLEQEWQMLARQLTEDS